MRFDEEVYPHPGTAGSLPNAIAPFDDFRNRFAGKLMHDTAFRIGSMAMQTYADLANATILEVGAQIVNGSLRSSALPTTKYVGIDIEEGDGVDLVVKPGEPWPVEDNAFDLVMATSVFEHDPAFWRTFLQMCRKTKLGGHIYISAPSNGKVHRYPQDFWRFYPDAGIALRSLAESEGIELTLVESFVAEREQDEWNDFCVVFRREPCPVSLSTAFICERIACTNAITWQSPAALNDRENTEDQVLLRREQEQIGRLLHQVESDKSAWNAEKQALAQRVAEAEIAQAKSEVLLNQANIELEHDRESLLEASVTAKKLAEADSELKAREHRIADLESNLRQRQEEISQAWAQLEAERLDKRDVVSELETRKAEVEALYGRLREADAWVFKLAGERREAELLGSRIEEELGKERELRLAGQERLSAALERLEELSTFADTLSGQLTRSGSELERTKVSLNNSERRVGELARALNSAQILKSELEKRLTAHFHETASLSKIILEREQSVAHECAKARKIRDVYDAVASQPRWWSILSRAHRSRLQEARLRRLGLFDGKSYLHKNPDVAEAGEDPLHHFLHHGIDEKRPI